METISDHFGGMAQAEYTPLANSSDCVVCGKSANQIQCETVNDYLDKTTHPNETLAETEARRRAFLDSMATGTFLLMPGRVLQAVTCDGKWYSHSYKQYNTLPGTIPLD